MSCLMGVDVDVDVDVEDVDVASVGSDGSVMARRSLGRY